MDLILTDILNEEDLVFSEQEILYAVNKLGYETNNKHNSVLKGYLLSDKRQNKTINHNNKITVENDFKYDVKNKKFEQYNINKPKAA